jgi:hypothetical protein
MLFPPERPPGSAGESCTFRRIIILKSRLNQHSEKSALFKAPHCFEGCLPLCPGIGFTEERTVLMKTELFFFYEE